MTNSTEFAFGTNADEFVPTGGGGDTTFIKYFSERETRLRFAHDWSGFRITYIHRDDDNKVSFPCPGDPHRDKCPGCQAKMKASAKIFGVAIDRATGYVNVWQLPISLKDDLARMQDRDGSMRKRDVTVYKDGKGLDTTYGLEKEDRSEEPEWPENMPSIQEALIESYRFGTDADYRNSKLNKDKDDADEKSVAREESKPVQEEKPPFDSEEAAESELPRGEMTEVEIRALSYLELAKLADHLGIKVDEDWSKHELADAIINHIS